MKSNLIPNSQSQAERIIKSGIGIVLLIIPIDYAMNLMQSDLVQEIVLYWTKPLMIIGAGLIVYGGIIYIRLSNRPVQYRPLSAPVTGAELNVSDLENSALRRVTESRLMVGFSLLLTGGILVAILVAVRESAVPGSTPWVAGIAALLLSIGGYAVGTYFSRTKKRANPVDSLASFAKHNGFRLDLKQSAQSIILNHLKETNYLNQLVSKRNIRTFFSIEGLLSQQKFLLASFESSRFDLGIVSCYISRPLQTATFDNLKNTILQATPNATDVIYSNIGVTVIFRDGLAIDRAAMCHYFTIINYIASLNTIYDISALHHSPRFISPSE